MAMVFLGKYMVGFNRSLSRRIIWHRPEYINSEFSDIARAYFGPFYVVSVKGISLWRWAERRAGYIAFAIGVLASVAANLLGWT